MEDSESNCNVGGRGVRANSVEAVQQRAQRKGHTALRQSTLCVSLFIFFFRKIAKTWNSAAKKGVFPEQEQKKNHRTVGVRKFNDIYGINIDIYTLLTFPDVVGRVCYDDTAVVCCTW